MTRNHSYGRPDPRRASRLLVAVSCLLLAAVGTAAAADEAEFDYSAVQLRVGVWIDKEAGEVYGKGDPMAVTVKTSEDAYAVVYRIDTEGRVTVLWPRSRMDDGFVFGGHEYVLPVQGGPALRTAQAEGEGFVEAIVSRYPFDLRALQLDFHHEPTAEPVDFRVVGDPFLAMNEVNFAITGLEDAEDEVVTYFASYYVHREVDHPRYLCGQCHFDDGPQYEPYGDTCTLTINVDYRWNNGWWDSYGYYPVYYNPCYVYVDPWAYRPWVNFWYDPWYRAPWGSVCYWPTTCYPWYDSPYYGGNCNTGYGGQARYAPLNPNGQGGDGTRTKTREYGPITPMLAGEGTTATRGGGALDARTAYKGEPRAARTAPTIGDAVRTRSTAGLRIREGGSVRGTAVDGDRVRHTAAGARTPASLVPVSGEPAGGGRRVTTPGTVGAAQQRAQQRTENDQRATTRSGAEGRAITPVAPRQKGTRIWNTGRSGSSDGTRRPEQVRPGRRSGGGDSSRDGTVRDRSNGSSGNNGSRGNSGSRSSGGDTRTRSGGSSGSNDKATRGGSGGSRVGSGSSRSGGSSGSSSGSSGGRSSGGSGGGGSRGGSSSGGSSGRRGG